MSSVAIQGNASGAGVFTIAAPNNASSFTSTLPANTGTLISNKTPGTVLQVVQTVKTDSFATAATVTDTAVTGLTVTITPTSSTSKILVIVDLSMSSENSQGGAPKLTRGGTAISLATAAGSRSLGSFSGGGYRGAAAGNTSFSLNQTLTYLDSPATTSATTYGVVVSSISTGTYVNRTGVDTDATDMIRSVSYITAMEIAA
jgi:hypothetical protein